MLEIIKIVANFGFPAVLCIYLLFSFRKTLDKLDDTIGNHLTSAIIKNTEVTKEDSESSKRVEKVLDKLDTSINLLINKIK